MTVARGPLRDAIPSYQQAAAWPPLEYESGDIIVEALNQELPPVEKIHLNQLVSNHFPLHG